MKPTTMDPILRKKLSILIRLAGIDGAFVQKEKAFIQEICQRQGVSKEECNDLIKNPEPIGSLGALTYNKAVEYMADSLSLMLADRLIHPREVLLCEDIALRLGFPKKEIDRIIEQLKEHPESSEKEVRHLVQSMYHPAKI